MSTLLDHEALGLSLSSTNIHVLVCTHTARLQHYAAATQLCSTLDSALDGHTVLHSLARCLQIASLGKRYLDTMRGRLPPGKENATRIIDKMLRNAWNVGFISLMLPRACFIHAVRHPLDTVLSCYAQPFEGRGTPWAWDLAGICTCSRH